MDPQFIIAAIEAGVSIFKAAGGQVGDKAASYINAGSSIIATAKGLFADVKDTLSASDVATIDAAVEAAHQRCGDDLARVLGELDAASKA